MKSNAGVLLLVCSVGGALAAAGCGPAPIRPQSFPDPEVSCPAGLISWRLEIVDQRAEPEATEKAVASIRSGIQDSFPGCRWNASSAESEGGTPKITVTILRLGVAEYDRYQEAAAEWTVTATTASGSTLTEFDANEEDSRPAYSGADEEALNEAFRRALQRTVKGLAAMQRLGSIRPQEGTLLAAGSAAVPLSKGAVNR